MRNGKVCKLLALMVALLSVVALLAACGSQDTGTTTQPGTEGQSSEAEYRVSVVNANGDPYTSGIIVCFHQNGEQVAMQVADENGTVTKVMEKGEYTVELMFTDSDVEYVYDKTDLTLTADKTALEISLAYAVSDRTMELYTGGEQHSGYLVDVCCTQVPLTPGQRSYFLFAPTEPGTYEVSAIGDVTGIGCYGTPFYVQEYSICEVEGNSFTTSIRADMIGSGEGGSTVLVIGIDTDSAESCILSVERIGDPAWSPEDEPYVIYQTTAKLSAYTLPAGANVKEFDLTAPTDTYTLVFNAEDGFYHLDSADGPLVLVRLGVDNKYMNCYKTVLTKTGVRRYFYDESGTFLRREAYDDCLREYFEYMDQKEGVYPLTEDLKYIIQNHGEHSGWWELTSETSIFQDDAGEPIPGINADIAWLFMCVYIAQ